MIDKISKIKEVLESPGDCRNEAVALCDEYIDGYTEYDTSTPEGMSEAVKQALADLGVTNVACGHEVPLEDEIHMALKQTDAALRKVIDTFNISQEAQASLQNEIKHAMLEKMALTSADHVPAMLGFTAYMALNVLYNALSKTCQSLAEDAKPHLH